jgi:hypothetical protein
MSHAALASIYDLYGGSFTRVSPSASNLSTNFLMSISKTFFFRAENGG